MVEALCSLANSSTVGDCLLPLTLAQLSSFFPSSGILCLLLDPCFCRFAVHRRKVKQNMHYLELELQQKLQELQLLGDANQQLKLKASVSRALALQLLVQATLQ